jgi:hypothetical protein
VTALATRSGFAVTALATRGRLAVIALPLILIGLAGAAAPAHAAPKTINGFVGGVPVGVGGPFEGPLDVAVYTAGDSDPDNDKIFVADNGRIQRLDVHGNFELMWGADVIAPGAPGDTGTGAEICTEATTGAENCQVSSPGFGPGEFSGTYGVAVNQATAQVYVLDRDNLRVQQFELDGTFVREWALEGAFFPGVAIAVDPVDGDVFVADAGNAGVQHFASDGTFLGTFGAPGAGLGEFGEGEPMRLAVDSNHIVYVSDSNDANRVQRYDAEAGAFLEPIACCSPDTPGAPLVEGITVGLEIDPDSDGPGPDEEHLLVARDPFAGDTVVQELDMPTPATDPVTTVVDTHVYEVDPDAPSAETDRDVRGIGVNPSNGNVYLATPSLATPAPGSGSFTGCPDPDRCVGLIVLNTASAPPAAVLLANGLPGPTAFSVTGTANAGGGVASYRFQLSTDGATWRDAGVGGYVSGTEDEPVSGELTGLQPNTLYRARIAVRRQDGFTSDVTTTSNELTVLTARAAPGVETLGSTQRTDRAARLQARIDPNGSATAYHFELGPLGGPLDRRIPIPDASAGSGNTPDLVTADVDGLQPETTYQYRVVATNVAGTSAGDLVSLTTEAAPLPRTQIDRGYELVSPADKTGGTGVGQWYSGPATNARVGYGAHVGERFAVLGYLGSVLIDGPYTYSTDWALAERTATGWVSKPGISRRAHGSQAKADISMTAAADDMSLMAWGSAHLLRLFPEMETWPGVESGATFLRRWASGEWQLLGPTDEAQGWATGSTPVISADGSVAVLSTPTLRGLAGPGDPTSTGLESGGSVYLDEVSDGMTDTFPGDDGVRTLVNVCTSGTELPAVTAGGELSARDCDSGLISPQGASLAVSSSSIDTDGAVSADGSRVFVMSPDPQAALGPCEGTGGETRCPPQLYAWQRNPGGNPVTRWISRGEVTGQAASLLGPAYFEGASADGDKVFFSTNSPLTADDPNGESAPPPGGVTTGQPSQESWDLYMYDLPDGPGADPAGGDLTRITAGPSGDGDCNSPFAVSGSGALRFTSDDASRSYFTCTAPLPGVPTPSNGTITTPGGTPTTGDATNLYAYDASRPAAQRWRFVARLPRTSPLGECATTALGRGAACINGTSDGSLLTFFTDGRLTGDDPDASSGDVYGYDALTDELSRLSAPRGVGVKPYPCRGEQLCFGDDGFRGAASDPLERLGAALHPSGARLAFFQSRSRLVPEDVDDAFDVYQWHDGDLSLISTGRSSTDGAFFAGNDKSGLNVYLTTRDRLTWEDKDAVLDVYTARIGGGFPEPPRHESCTLGGDACQGPGAGPPASRIVSRAPGDGNATRAEDEPTILRPSRRARRRAARTGVLALRVKAPDPGLLVTSARARVGGKGRRVAVARKPLARPGTAKVRLRLARPARRGLATGRRLRLRLSASVDGVRADPIVLGLKRGRR